MIFLVLQKVDDIKSVKKVGKFQADTLILIFTKKMDKKIILINNFDSGTISREQKVVLNWLFKSANEILNIEELSKKIGFTDLAIGTILLELNNLGFISIGVEKVTINMERFQLV